MISENQGLPGAPPGITVGVSSCLLGQMVRYDGGHAQDRYILDTLATHFTLLPVCPEAEIGMGTPRETVRLVGDPAAPRMVGSRSETDWTAPMNTWSRRRVRELADHDLCGYIFKKNSPSCGVFRVKVYQAKGSLPLKGTGLFAAEFAARNPLLPVEEEGRLNDPHLRENFIERIFALHRLKKVFAGRWQRGALIEFHAREKYLLMAHHPQGLKQLGQLAAAVAQHSPAAFRDRYMAAYMAILAKPATVRKHANTLQHIAGYLRTHVSDEERRRVLAVVDDYRVGLVPLIVPMTLIRHYIELHDVAYVNRQVYLNPHPRELMLRNHV
jgi:uncharacterized protein YbgA (DUF1722 family)/uncharacterized protein YbbK (DUF523 family)